MTIEEKAEIILRIAKSSEAEHDKYQAIRSVLAADSELATPEAPSFEAIARKHLHIIGVPESLIGYDYLCKAVTTVAENPDAVYNMVKGLYVGVGNAFGTTANRAERAIRHAIEVTWDRMSYETKEKYFGENGISLDKCKPTNSEFIARLARIVRQEHGEENWRYGCE